MIYGIGTDLLKCDRLSRSLSFFGHRFLQRIASEKEIEALFLKRHKNLSFDVLCQDKKFLTSVGKIFSTKEACSKALGTGFRHGITWHDFFLMRDASGKPCVEITGKAKEHILSTIYPHQYYKIDVSISDEWPYVQTFAVISVI